MNIQDLGGGKYRVFIEGAKDYKGNRKRYSKRFTAKTKKELKRLIEEWESTLDLNRTERGMLVNTMCHDVWPQVIQGKSPNTIYGYEAALRRIEATIGLSKVDLLSPRTIQAWLNDLATTPTETTGKPLSPKTIKDTYSVLNQCCKIAVAWDILLKNPCHDIILPKKEKKEIPILSSEDFTTFCANLDKTNPNTKVMIELALFGSLRRGEIMGIRADQIRSNRFYLDEARYAIRAGQDFTKDVKTPSGKRMVTIPDFVVEDVKRLRLFHKKEKLRLGGLWVDSDYLIKGEDGRPLNPTEANKRLHKYMKSIGLEPISFHGLRHTYASICIQNGADLTTVSRRMGHANVSTTLSIYTHLFEQQKEGKDPIASYFDDIVSR